MDDQATDHATDQAAEESDQNPNAPTTTQVGALSTTQIRNFLPATTEITSLGTAQHPALAVVDALEKYLETELPMATFLMVQDACAEIREHLQ